MLKVGILGGGQLGRMLLQAAANYPVETYVMENDADCPAAHLCHHFVKGDIRSYNDVYAFGKGLDALTIEIESVNDDALAALEAEGVKVYPRTAALRIIKNKIEQKQFYASHAIPSAHFVITRSLQELEQHADFFPAVHKLGSGGYDGRGVQVIASAEEAGKGFDAPAVLEKKINIHKEIAQIVAVNDAGQTALYPPVDMVFDPELNLLDYQVSPAELAETILWKVEAIALRVVKALESPGIFAVELFIDKVGEVYVNETAPRVHNSGHHTIEGNYSSQFDMLWRIVLGYPLGNTAAILPAAIVNVLGEDDQSGTAQYDGLEDVLQMDNVFVHIYGKKETKPGRKMGHVTILSSDRKDLTYKQRRIRQVLSVVSGESKR
ncbi:MAG TPA: 5-(carboxyamino)imidazole ribonucleotide synthase [Agriterribacter sp.]|nr:5-(carboxyamino)imidazole ribonucleotide synthase [Agriterribacter sp.]HRQ49705.1 5-(carboxyamino)imidazole ribonucleotide synthase [Agriterribacter sp.]